jgi:hypothetical protein
MKTLTISQDSFDTAARFTINLSRKNGLYSEASLHKDYNKKGDGIFWALQKSACLKSHYSAEDIAHGDRLRNMTPLAHGDLVLIEGEQYKVRVLGNFSDCAIFDKV